MDATNMTIEILKSIRDEVKSTNARLDQTNGRLESMREELVRHIVESELRTATAITDLAGTVREMTSVLRSQVELRPRVEKCEQEILEIRRHLKFS